MAPANLYIEEINLLKYFNKVDCALCGFPSCMSFINALKDGLVKPQDCSHIQNKRSIYALEAVQRIKDLWPEVPLLTHPRPSFVGLIELNKPKLESPVLISGNNEYTEQVLLTVLSTTVYPFLVIFVDTDGNTVDMAMVYKTLTAERVCNALRETGIEERVKTREIIIPGLAFPLKEEIEKLTGWQVRVGPLCAAELPLFLSEVWLSPHTI